MVAPFTALDSPFSAIDVGPRKAYCYAGSVKVVDMRYAIVIEPAGGNYSAYVPDLPGCVATGATLQEVEEEMREAITFHLEGLREDGLPVPPPSSRVEYLEVAA